MISTQELKHGNTAIPTLNNRINPKLTFNDQEYSQDAYYENRLQIATEIDNLLTPNSIAYIYALRRTSHIYGIAPDNDLIAAELSLTYPTMSDHFTPDFIYTQQQTIDDITTSLIPHIETLSTWIWNNTQHLSLTEDEVFESLILLCTKKLLHSYLYQDNTSNGAEIIKLFEASARQMVIQESIVEDLRFDDISITDIDGSRRSYYDKIKLLEKYHTEEMSSPSAEEIFFQEDNAALAYPHNGVSQNLAIQTEYTLATSQIILQEYPIDHILHTIAQLPTHLASTLFYYYGYIHPTLTQTEFSQQMGFNILTYIPQALKQLTATLQEIQTQPEELVRFDLSQSIILICTPENIQVDYLKQRAQQSSLFALLETISIVGSHVIAENLGPTEEELLDIIEKNIQYTSSGIAKKDLATIAQALSDHYQFKIDTILTRQLIQEILIPALTKQEYPENWLNDLYQRKQKDPEPSSSAQLDTLINQWLEQGSIPTDIFNLLTQEQQRYLTYLSDYPEMPYKDIAIMLGVSKQIISSQIINIMTRISNSES